MLTNGLLGAITITSAVSSASSTRGRDGRVRAGEVEPVDRVAMAAGDEPLLNENVPCRCLDERAEPVVGRGGAA